MVQSRQQRFRDRILRALLLAAVGGILVLFWSTNAAVAATCEGWVPDVAPIDVEGVTAESSGLAPAALRKDVWYTHGDHGGDALLYAFDASGAPLGTHALPGVELIDWEDLADAPCPDTGRCLYLGDIGDNDATRANIAIRVVREPSEEGAQSALVATWTAVYPDGPHDAESLLVHPCSGTVYVVTKEDDVSRVFRLPTVDDGGVAVLVEVARLQLEGGAATGGDWDAEGDRVALRNDADVFLWATDPQDPEGHWDDEPIRLASPVLGTGEALAFGPDHGVWLTAEASPMPFAHLACLDPQLPVGECVFPQTGTPAGCCANGEQSAFVVPLVLLAWRRRGVRARRSGPRGPADGCR